MEHKFLCVICGADILKLTKLEKTCSEECSEKLQQQLRFTDTSLMYYPKLHSKPVKNKEYYIHQRGTKKERDIKNAL